MLPLGNKSLSGPLGFIQQSKSLFWLLTMSVGLLKVLFEEKKKNSSLQRQTPPEIRLCAYVWAVDSQTSRESIVTNSRGRKQKTYQCLKGKYLSHY